MQNVTLEIFQNSSCAICDQECVFDHCCGSRDRNICQNIHSIDNVLHNLYIRHVYICTSQAMQPHITLQSPNADAHDYLHVNYLGYLWDKWHRSLWAGCPYYGPTNKDKVLKETQITGSNYGKGFMLSSSTIRLVRTRGLMPLHQLSHVNISVVFPVKYYPKHIKTISAPKSDIYFKQYDMVS